MASTYDVILVLHPFRTHVREHETLCRALRDLDAHYLLGAEGFHQAQIDTALVVLRFSARAADRLGGRFLQLFARRCGLPMIVPAELDAETRRKFFLGHLSRYTTYVQQYCSKREGAGVAERVVATLGEHVSHLPAPERRERFDPYAALPISERRRTVSSGLR